jgi:hypothetical protein
LINGTTASALSVAPIAVPEPSTLLLAAAGLGTVLLGWRRNRSR